ncbi:Eps11J [gamma proteobacterium BDW918]|nr:Eps11J [gamma proteobacterium BDW918]
MSDQLVEGGAMAGVRVLLIAPMFFGYEKLIKKELEDQGATVDYFNDRPDDTFLTKSLIRINRQLIARKTNFYYDKIIGSVRDTHYDHILIVRGEAISKERLIKLRSSQPRAKITLYLWDSMHYNPNARVIKSYVDRVLSFDRVDVDENSDIEFLPLFYGREFEKAANISDGYLYDACFIGTIHTDRYRVLEKIIEALESDGLKVFIYCYYPSKILYILRAIVDSGFRRFAKKYIDFSGMKLSDVVARIAESRTVIDVNRPGQRGLTMRTIEAVGAQRKLITTNTDIVNYNIYTSESVCLVCRSSPIITMEFFSRCDNPYLNDVRNEYSVESWVKQMFYPV